MYILKYYSQLLKVRLSITVVFSACAGYLLGAENFSIKIFSLVLIGGFLVTGSANGLNQILEREYDKLMERTCNRPLPRERLSVTQALFFSLFIGGLGLYMLNLINPQSTFFGVLSKSCFFGLLSMVLYVLVYTPLKRISPISIFAGAIPGAIPFLLGWVAATNYFGFTAGILFAIQFLWQFPHFIAIAWVMDDQYKKAGFKMMFGKEKGKLAVIIAFISSFLMLFVTITPFIFYIPSLHLSVYGFLFILLLGFWFVLKTIILYRNMNVKHARVLMKASFIYLPLIQIVYLFDKWLSL